MFNKLKRYARDPYYALGNDMIQKCPHLMSDKFYLSVLWKMKMGYKLDWKHPKTFNEKLQWLKLYNHDALYITLVDKYRVKQWVAEKIGKQYVNPTLAVYNFVDEIDLDALPAQFVLKCNHDSGSVVICKDKATFDLDAAKRKLRVAMKKNFYWEAREWPYKNVKRVILADEYLDDHLGDELRDYKFYCFNGEPKIVYCTNKGRDIYENFYDMDFNTMDISHGFRRFEPEITKPEGFETMKRNAALLSAGIPFVRVDFNEVEGRVLFGEFTFFDWAGFCKIQPKEWDDILGDWIKLPTDK